MNQQSTAPLSTPPHKQTDPEKYPGQIPSPAERDAMKRNALALNYGTSAKAYKPAHGGYPGNVKVNNHA